MVAWDQVVRERNIYLSTSYLQALEGTMNDKIQFFYATVKNGEGKVVQVAAFQLVQFNYSGNNHSKFVLKKICHHRSVDGTYQIALLVGGNVFANGENVSIWTDEITDHQAMAQVFEIVKQIKAISGVKRKISIQLFKEFWPSSAEKIHQVGTSGYKAFQVDVNMVLKLSEDWKCFDDYLNQMKTKFRTKAKGVFKKSDGIRIVDMSVDDIEQHKETIHRLFMNVVNRSDYSLGAIEPLTFGAFKKALGDKFHFYGAFLEDKMVGFSTSFENGKVLEANYVGLDYEVNQQYSIYQRLLYGYVEQAIKKGKSELHLGRTSETIKSSIGAEPVNMTLYAKHKSLVPNLILSLALNFVKPRKFQLRPPFKNNN